MNINPDRLIYIYVCVEGLIHIGRSLLSMSSIYQFTRIAGLLYNIFSQMEGISSRDFPHKRGEITHTKYIWAVGNDTLITATI